MKKYVKQLIVVLLSFTFMMSNLDDEWEMDYDKDCDEKIVVFDGEKSLYNVYR